MIHLSRSSATTVLMFGSNTRPSAVTTKGTNLSSPSREDHEGFVIT